LFELNSKQEKWSSYGFAVVYVPLQNEVFWVKKQNYLVAHNHYNNTVEICVILLGESHSVYAKEMQRSYRFRLITGRSTDLSSILLVFGDSFLKNMLPTSLG